LRAGGAGSLEEGLLLPPSCSLLVVVDRSFLRKL
jgi:hypothetical protein